MVRGNVAALLETKLTLKALLLVGQRSGRFGIFL